MKIGFGWTVFVCALAVICLSGVAAAQEDTSALPDGTTIIDDIEPYDGPIGPGSPLYGLKIALEDLDESFTANETERFNKQLNHARLRLSEVRRELQLNNTDAADQALDLYWQKTNITQLRLQVYSASNATGLLHAQEMITKHQLVLENLLDTHPNNTGLVRAYDNSLALEQKFEEKTQMRFERVMQKNNATIIKAVKLEVRELERTENAGNEQALQVQQAQEVKQVQGNGKDDDKNTGKAVKKVTAAPVTVRPQTVETASTAEPAGQQGNNGKGNLKKADDTGGSGGSTNNGNAGSGDSNPASNPGQGNGGNR